MVRTILRRAATLVVVVIAAAPMLAAPANALDCTTISGEPWACREVTGGLHRRGTVVVDSDLMATVCVRGYKGELTCVTVPVVFNDTGVDPGTPGQPGVTSGPTYLATIPEVCDPLFGCVGPTPIELPVGVEDPNFWCPLLYTTIWVDGQGMQLNVQCA